jgi:hypothetical protein
MLKGLFGAAIEPQLHYFLDFFKKYCFNIFSNIKFFLKSDFYYYYEHPQNMINQGQHSLKMAIS